MIALGWSLERVAEGALSHPVEGLWLLAAEASDPAQVLALQCDLVQRGVDLLPLSPGRPVPLPEALAQTSDQAEDLRRRLDALRGQVQVTLHLAWTDPQSAADTGRAWLAERRARLQRAEQAARALAALGQSLALPATEVETRSSSALIHLLVPRDRPLDMAPMETSGLDGRLTVIRPLPPLAFAA